MVRPHYATAVCQSSNPPDWQRLADVPEEQFEAALNDTNRKPSTAGILADATPPKPEIVPVSSSALWLWGRLALRAQGGRAIAANQSSQPWATKRNVERADVI